MDRLADAIVYAVSYIAHRVGDDDETYLREDTKSLEFLAYLLQDCSDVELDRLAAAAKRALATELAAGAAPDSWWVRDYGRWMEDMFGDGWSGNDRV